MAFTEIDEKLLVRAYQAGDERAFDTIVRTQYNALYAHALKRLTQHEAAEDAVQDTLLRAYRALPNLDGDLALRAWLHRILTNVCHDEGNRRRRNQGVVDKVAALPEETAADPVDDALLHETVRVMSEALADLPESYREALVLRYVDGLSFREVAEATGVSEENARARVHRGRVALHKVLSRLSVMAAFLIPGLRRATHAADTSTAAAAPSADTVNLATQLTSHVVQAAPTVTRLADAASSFGPAKAAVAAAAMTAVAAVSVPVAVHQIDESSRTPDRPAAAPAPEQKSLTSTSTTLKPGSSATSTTVQVTTTIAPPSQLHPFEEPPAPRANVTTVPPSQQTTTTTTSAPAGPVVEGTMRGDGLSDTSQPPQYDVAGPVTIVANGHATSASLRGRIYVYQDGSSESDDLMVTFGDTVLDLRYRGSVADSSYRIVGAYTLTNARAVGLAGRGDVTVKFTPNANTTTASLSFELRGRSSS